MNRFFESLRPFIRGVVKKPWLVLFIATLFAVVGGYYASSLKIDTDFSKLIPEDYPSYQALEKVRETVGGEGSDLAVGIVSPSFKANKAFAEDLIPKALELKGDEYEKPYLRTVEYKRDTEFMEKNALYFATDKELNKIKDYLKEEIKQAKLEANPFYTDFSEGDDSTNESGVTIGELDSVYQQLVGKEYPVSDDSTTMTLRFFPEGSQTNISFINNLYEDFEKLLSTMEPSKYHPEMEITLAGRLMRRSIQVEAIRNDVAKTFGVGASAVILLVIFYFLYKSYSARAGSRFSWKILITELARMPILALVITIPLLMSLAWTFGLAYLTVGNLNIMTSTLALLLFGLGVDFGVHFYGRYSEERGMDNSITDAAEISFMSTGQAVSVGALTTSTALLVLTFADFKGFSEFGWIAGIGILFAVIAMIVVMPAVLAIFEKTGLLNLSKAGGFEDRGPVKNKRMPANKLILAVSVLAVVGSLVMLPSVSFEYDFSKLEPTYPEYEAKDEIVDRVSSSRTGSNPAYIVVDTPEEAVKVAEAVREKARKDTLSPTIKEVQTLQERFPLQKEEKQERLKDIAEIRELLKSQYLQNENSDEIQRLRRAAQTREPISPKQVPDYLKDTFTTQSGEIGKFVMIYPSVGLSDGRKSIAFANDVGTIITDDGEKYHAGSTSLIAAEMLRLMQEESPYMVGAVFIIVAIIMLAYFRSFKWAGLALIPLVVGLLWMLLVVELFGPKLNFFNLVVLPAMLGIGNDDGIHLVHRYRERGKGSIMKVLRSTGEHCTIASLTTMIGFFGLLFSFHPGLRSIGELAVIGAVTTLLAALLFLPALIQWIEDLAAKKKSNGNV